MDLYYSLPQWQQALILLVFSLAVFIILRSVVLRLLKRLAASTENDLDDRLVDFIRHLFGVVLVFLLVVGLLRIYDIKITPLLAGAGIAGIAVGLAAKETLSDVLAGVFLIADRPIRVGDRIKIERIGAHWGAWGDVVDIGLRRTRIRNTDGVLVTYPNALLANSVVTNFSFDHQPVRVRIRFQVNYDVDFDRMRSVAKAAIDGTSGVVEGSAQLVTRSLWDDERGHLLSGVLVEARYKLADVRTRTPVRSAVLENLLSAFKAAEIDLAVARVEVAQRGTT